MHQEQIVDVKFLELAIVPVPYKAVTGLASEMTWVLRGREAEPTITSATRTRDWMTHIRKR